MITFFRQTKTDHCQSAKENEQVILKNKLWHDIKSFPRAVFDQTHQPWNQNHVELSACEPPIAARDIKNRDIDPLAIWCTHTHIRMILL